MPGTILRVNDAQGRFVKAGQETDRPLLDEGEARGDAGTQGGKRGKLAVLLV